MEIVVENEDEKSSSGSRSSFTSNSKSEISSVNLSSVEEDFNDSVQLNFLRKKTVRLEEDIKRKSNDYKVHHNFRTLEFKPPIFPNVINIGKI